MIVLRPYQTKLNQDINWCWNAGYKNVLAVLPTGGGKSISVSDLVLTGNTMGMWQCIIAHRTELVSQMSLHVARRGVHHRLIAPNKTIAQVIREHRREFNGRSFINPDAICAVGGVDTILSRDKKLENWARRIDRWTIDEAHHVLKENKWGKVVNMFPLASGLGVTATPKRADGNGLGRHVEGVFDVMVEGPTMRQLIDMGNLSDYQIAIPESDYKIDNSAVTATGDFSKKKMKEASQKSRIVGDVVKEYMVRSYGKRAICFATDVETANDMGRRFNEAGIPAASVSAKTPSETRNEFIRRFRNDELKVLVNVDLFGEGFDVPAVSTVIMARPTASLAVYLQQFGRALRPMPGKEFGLIIDHVSNWKRHGFPDKNHVWDLERREKRSKKQPHPDEIELTACKNCSRPYERSKPACPICGFQPVAAGAGRSIDEVDGDLILLDRATIAAMQQSTKLESPVSVYKRIVSTQGEIAARGQMNRQIEKHQSQQELQKAIEQWGGIQRHMGVSDQESHRKFYLTTGVDVLTALTLSRKDMDALRAKIIGWYS